MNKNQKEKEKYKIFILDNLEQMYELLSKDKEEDYKDPVLDRIKEAADKTVELFDNENVSFRVYTQLMRVELAKIKREVLDFFKKNGIDYKSKK